MMALPLMVTVPPLPNATTPLLPGVTMPPLPSATVPPLVNVKVPPPGIVIVPPLLSVTVPPLPSATVPPLPNATVPPLPNVAVPIGSMFFGAVVEPKESMLARDANSPPVAPTWRRSMLAQSLYPRICVFSWPSKLMSCPPAHAGLIDGAMGPFTREAWRPLRGVPSQCNVAGLPADTPAVKGAYQDEVENVAGWAGTSVVTSCVTGEFSFKGTSV